MWTGQEIWWQGHPVVAWLRFFCGGLGCRWTACLLDPLVFRWRIGARAAFRNLFLMLFLAFVSVWPVFLLILMFTLEMLLRITHLLLWFNKFTYHCLVFLIVFLLHYQKSRHWRILTVWFWGYVTLIPLQRCKISLSLMLNKKWLCICYVIPMHWQSYVSMRL